MMALSVLDSVELPGRAYTLLQARFVLLESLGKRKIANYRQCVPPMRRSIKLASGKRSI